MRRKVRKDLKSHFVSPCYGPERGRSPKTFESIAFDRAGSFFAGIELAQMPPFAMKAVLYEAFSDPPRIVNVPDPAPEPHGVVVKVMATGVCRSDWHGWVGHDPGYQASPCAGP